MTDEKIEEALIRAFDPAPDFVLTLIMSIPFFDKMFPRAIILFEKYRIKNKITKPNLLSKSIMILLLVNIVYLILR